MERKSFIFIVISILLITVEVSAASLEPLKRLQKAYPAYVKEVTPKYITWNDDTKIPVRAASPIANLFAELFYPVDVKIGQISKLDIEREHYEAVFKKMYGHSHGEVRKKLVTIYWMPSVFGTRFPLKVTTINGVDKKLRRISAALEKLPAEYHKYVANPAGSFYWRRVLGESYLSTHSFGIAIDINLRYSSYWLWDLQRLKCRVKDLKPHNRIPKAIVDIFEKEGFYWGGHWYYYDTMHFEYRPDLFIKT